MDLESKLHPLPERFEEKRREGKRQIRKVIEKYDKNNKINSKSIKECIIKIRIEIPAHWRYFNMRQKLLLIISLLLAVTGCGTANHDNEARAPKSLSELKGQNFQDVVTLFESAGFNNIETEKIEDLIMGWLTKDGEVESVSIGGDTEYSTSKWYPKDTKVRISYHTFPEKENEETSSNIQEKNDSISTQFGDYLMDIPDSWIKTETYYYAETGEGVTIFSYDIPDIEVSSFEILDSVKTDYLNGGKESFENVKNDSMDTMVINDNKVIVNTFDAEINGRNIKMEIDLLLCPESKRLLALMFGQSEKSSHNHFDDYHKALSTLRLKSEEGKQVSATPKPTKSPSPTKTPSSSKKDTMDVNEFVDYVNEYLNQHETSNLKFEAKRFLGTVYVNIIMDNAYGVQAGVYAGDSESKEMWDSLIQNATSICNNLKSQMDSNGISGYDLSVDIKDSNDIENSIARITNGNLVFDATYGIDNR